jgi:hypothetical protein
LGFGCRDSDSGLGYRAHVVEGLSDDVQASLQALSVSEVDKKEVEMTGKERERESKSDQEIEIEGTRPVTSHKRARSRERKRENTRLGENTARRPGGAAAGQASRPDLACNGGISGYPLRAVTIDCLIRAAGANRDT